ncbi:glutamate receptor ionotropic, delta-1-like [Procambarus clarkii]|uniref:glutamate receptor ionotropic, delta-1-like n=1 Tax=Procambarus clarkii TaxID=6728 RepID=UPI003743326D
MDFTTEIYNEALVMIEDLCLDIADKVLNQLEMPSPNQSAAASFDVELRREQSYNTGDLLSYVKSNIPNLPLERKGIYNQTVQTVNNELGEIFLDAPGRTGELWVALLLSVVMWGVTLWLLQRAWQKVAGGHPVGLITSLLYGYGALLQNLPSDPSVSVSGRMLVGWWLVFCLIITTGFSSSLMAHLTVKERSRPLETLEDLVNQPHWKWGTEHWVLTEAAVNFYSNHPNPVFRHIYHKLELMQVDDALRKVLAGGFSFISYKNYVTVIIETRYSDARGNTPLYISKKAFPILADYGWCIRKGAPFHQRFAQLINRLEAAGIITYWTEDVMARRVREDKKVATLHNTTLLGNANQDEGEEVVLSLNHLQGAFYMLLVGSCVAFLTLLGENLAHCCSSPQ